MGSGASSGSSSPASSDASFSKGDRVECRDKGKEWRLGTVTDVLPLEVRPDGWDKGFTWDEVRKPKAGGPASSGASSGASFSEGDRVEFRDKGEEWRVGTVRRVQPLEIQPDGWSFGCPWDEVRKPKAGGPASSGTSSGASFSEGDRVEVRDKGKEWRLGTVTQVHPLEVQQDGWPISFTWDEVRKATISSPTAQQKAEAVTTAELAALLVLRGALEVNQDIPTDYVQAINAEAEPMIHHLAFDPTRFRRGQPVECRDYGKDWHEGIVMDLHPIRVRVGGFPFAFEWDEVRPLQSCDGYQVGDRVAFSPDQRRVALGTVTDVLPLRVRLDGSEYHIRCHSSMVCHI